MIAAMTRLSRLASLCVVVSLMLAGYAYASHLTVTSKKLGSAKAAVNQCMTGSQMTFTYYLNSSGKVATVVVGNIASTCGGGALNTELNGSTSPLPEGLGLVTITSSSSCSQPGGAGTVYSCSLSVGSPPSPGSVTNNYASITGP